MNMNKSYLDSFKDEIWEYYSYWLQENYSDELHCKDDLIQAEERLLHLDVFVLHLKSIAERL